MHLRLRLRLHSRSTSIRSRREKQKAPDLNFHFACFGGVTHCCFSYEQYTHLLGPCTMPSHRIANRQSPYSRRAHSTYILLYVLYSATNYMYGMLATMSVAGPKILSVSICEIDALATATATTNRLSHTAKWYPTTTTNNLSISM